MASKRGNKESLPVFAGSVTTENRSTGTLLADNATRPESHSAQWQVARSSHQQVAVPTMQIQHKERCDLCVAQLDSTCVTTSCGHSYHQKCLESYVKQLIHRKVDNIRCPACMVPLNVNLSSPEKSAIPAFYQQKAASAQALLLRNGISPLSPQAPDTSEHARMPLEYRTSSPTPIPAVSTLDCLCFVRGRTCIHLIDPQESAESLTHMCFRDREKIAHLIRSILRMHRMSRLSPVQTQREKATSRCHPWQRLQELKPTLVRSPRFVQQQGSATSVHRCYLFREFHGMRFGDASTRALFCAANQCGEKNDAHARRRLARGPCHPQSATQ